MFESRCVPKAESPTHNHGRVCRIREKGYILGLRYDISPAEFHVNSEIDIR